MKVGYVRVSTTKQNTDRQDILMKELGVGKVYIEKLTGKNDNRPQLKEMMGFVRDGDTVIVESIGRFARNTVDLLELVEQLTAKGVEFVSQKENIDTTTPTGKFILTVFAAQAQLERECMIVRQREGIDAALAKGVKFGRKRRVPLKKFEKEYQAVIDGTRTKAQVARELQICTTSFRNYEKELLAKKNEVASPAHNFSRTIKFH